MPSQPLRLCQGNLVINLKLATKCLIIKTEKCNVYIVKDVVNNNGKFLSIQEFNQKYNINVGFLDYYDCISSVDYLQKSRGLHSVSASGCSTE